MTDMMKMIEENLKRDDELASKKFRTKKFLSVQIGHDISYHYDLKETIRLGCYMPPLLLQVNMGR